jgi:hypothetical protein
LKKLSKTQMVEAYLLNRLRHGSDPVDDDHTVDDYLSWLDDDMVEFIEEGLVEYNPQMDALRWIGPTDKAGRPVDPRNM